MNMLYQLQYILLFCCGSYFTSWYSLEKTLEEEKMSFLNNARKYFETVLKSDNKDIQIRAGAHNSLEISIFYKTTMTML